MSSDVGNEDETYEEPVKAYKNLEFLTSKAGRGMRILAEFLEPEDRFERFKISDTIVFFGSSRTLPRDVAVQKLADANANGDDVPAAEMALEMSKYYEQSRELSRRITSWSKGLKGRGKRFVVCTGGGPGIMEAANRGAADVGGDNIGLNISLPFEQHENPYISNGLTFKFNYFFMRKFWFSYLAKAIVVFPGGYGTMDELFELLTLVSTKKMNKPMPIILVGESYWNAVLNLDVMEKHGTISPSDLNLFKVVDNVDEAYAFLTAKLTEYHMDKPGGGM